LNGSGEVLSEMTGDTIGLGENSTASQISLCGGTGKIRTNSGSLKIGIPSPTSDLNMAALTLTADADGLSYGTVGIKSLSYYFTIYGNILSRYRWSV
jgi:hypothetical protein